VARIPRRRSASVRNMTKTELVVIVENYRMGAPNNWIDGRDLGLGYAPLTHAHKIAVRRRRIPRSAVTGATTNHNVHLD
jgi:hypothetical protein